MVEVDKREYVFNEMKRMVEEKKPPLITNDGSKVNEGIIESQ